MRAFFLLLFFFTGAAHSALVGRLPSTPGGNDYQAWYDQEQDITWLANGNYPLVEDYGLSVGLFGALAAPYALAWINALDYGGYTDWRLPNMDTDENGVVSLNFTNELYGLYALHGVYCENSNFNCDPGGPILDLSPYDYFGTLEAGFTVIVDGDYEVASLNLYSFFNNTTDTIGTGSDGYILPVADGDVFYASVVPIPAAAWLFSSALFGLGWFRKVAT